VLVSPSAEHYFFIDERQEQGRTQRYPTPVHDLFVKPSDDLAYLLFRAEVLDCCGQPFDLLAQLQRGGQELLGRHALAAQVLSQPVICFCAVRKRFAGPGQIIEGTSLRRLINSLVNPRGKADPWRLTLCHTDEFSSLPGRSIRSAARPG
jgi:hypothetical protein